MTADYTFVAPDVPAQAAVGPTVLEGLLGDLAALPTPTVTLPVPGRPGYTVRYATDLPYETLAMLRRGAQDKQMVGGLNEIALATGVLTTLCRAIQLDGEDLTDQAEPVTFFSPTLQKVLGVSRPADAVRRFYGRDGHVGQVADTVMREAGYGGGAADPTTSG